MDIEGRQEFVSRHRPAETRVSVRHGRAVVNPQILQVVDKLATVARPATALHHFAREVSQAQQRAWIPGAPGRHQQRKGGRLDPVHALSHQGQAIIEFMDLYRVGHWISSYESFLGPRDLRVGNFNGLVDGTDRAEPQVGVEPNRACVLRRYF